MTPPLFALGKCGENIQLMTTTATRIATLTLTITLIATVATITYVHYYQKQERLVSFESMRARFVIVCRFVID
jgi:hypothetical protein